MSRSAPRPASSLPTICNPGHTPHTPARLLRTPTETTHTHRLFWDTMATLPIIDLDAFLNGDATARAREAKK